VRAGASRYPTLPVLALRWCAVVCACSHTLGTPERKPITIAARTSRERRRRPCSRRSRQARRPRRRRRRRCRACRARQRLRSRPLWQGPCLRLHRRRRRRRPWWHLAGRHRSTRRHRSRGGGCSPSRSRGGGSCPSRGRRRAAPFGCGGRCLPCRPSSCPLARAQRGTPADWQSLEAYPRRSRAPCQLAAPRCRGIPTAATRRPASPAP